MVFMCKCLPPPGCGLLNSPGQFRFPLQALVTL